MFKNVKYVIPAYDIDMGGVIVKQALPTQQVDQVDPFLLLHHGRFKAREDAPALHQGLGPHPHRGFTPVTFVIDGEVHHRDSRENNQIACQGEVQWMHAGAGIIHSERPSEALAERNGTQEVVQLWINSPANKKMVPPDYQYIPDEEIPVFLSTDCKFKNKVIAGQYNQHQGKIKTQSDLLILWSYAEANASQVLTIPEKFNSMLYVLRGELRVTGFGKVLAESLVIFDELSTEIEISTDSSTQYLLLAGSPIDESIVHQGPFVMNTTSEILEAMRDYQMGKMGVLIEEK
ncbi:MAG: pirin family protein [Candidatus Marinimicrobia bacterium]|nr:pirin family protein [Candidatus Neomarinimicrobiota bacterium]